MFYIACAVFGANVRTCDDAVPQRTNKLFHSHIEENLQHISASDPHSQWSLPPTDEAVLEGSSRMLLRRRSSGPFFFVVR